MKHRNRLSCISAELKYSLCYFSVDHREAEIKMSIKCQILIIVLSSLYFNNTADRKIFNGTQINIEDFPFMVKIFEEKNYLHCTGSYVHPKWVLTAFHCVKNVINYPEKVLCCMGSEIIDQRDCKFSRHVNKIAYPDNTITSDIALLKIKPFVLSPKIQVGRMLKLGEGSGDILGGMECKVAGWGITETQKISDVLLLAEVKVLRICYDKYSLCVLADYQGPCPGDSGAPLMCFDDNIIVGVLSTGDKVLCGSRPMMAKFVQLDLQLDFIQHSIETYARYESASLELDNSRLLIIFNFFILMCLAYFQYS